jgi:hypothetical protein
MVKLERCDGIDFSNIIRPEFKNHSFERVSRQHLKDVAMISAVLVCFCLPYLCGSSIYETKNNASLFHTLNGSTVNHR